MQCQNLCQRPLNAWNFKKTDLCFVEVVIFRVAYCLNVVLWAQARSAAQQPLPGGAVGALLQGLVQVDAHCGLPEGLPALTQLLTDALKGALPGCHRPLQVTHSYSLLRHFLF